MSSRYVSQSTQMVPFYIKNDVPCQTDWNRHETPVSVLDRPGVGTRRTQTTLCPHIRPVSPRVSDLDD